MAVAYEIGNDKTLSVTGLAYNGSAINDATVTYAIKTAAGTTVASGTLTPAGSGGDYSKVIESAVTGLFVDGAKYVQEITIVSGSRDAFDRNVFIPTFRDES